MTSLKEVSRMNELSEQQAEHFRREKKEKQNRHAEWKQKNTQILLDTDYEFKATNNGENLVFREKGKPRVDFYPSTGRWRDVDTKRTFRGGPRTFLKWYGGNNDQKN